MVSIGPKRGFRGFLAAALVSFSLATQAAGGCVVAKKQGNSLGIHWVAQPGLSVRAAIEEAKRRLREQGLGLDRYEGLFPQANTPLEHAYGVVVRTEYTNARGKPRVSYGCGFSDVSQGEAEWAALRDLQSYSWGWTPSKGYEVVERFQY